MKGFMLFIIMVTSVMIFFVVDRDKTIQKHIWNKVVKIYEVIRNDDPQVIEKDM